MDSTLHKTGPEFRAAELISPKTGWLLASLLALVHVVLAVAASVNESPTFDEPTHLTAGYSYWLKHDYRLDPENGNLPARWASLPLLFNKLKFPPENGHAWQHASVGKASRQFFFESGNDADTILLQGRLMMSLFGGALCLLVFGWTRSLFGYTAAFISEAIMTFDPNMLAHSALVTSDVPAAFFFTASIWSVWRLFQFVRPGTLVIAALSVAGLFLTKMSAPSFLLMAGLLGLIRIFSAIPIGIELPWLTTAAVAKTQKLAAICSAGSVIGLTAFAAIWLSFGFRYSALTEGGQPRQILDARWDFLLDGTGAVGSALRFVRDHRLLPEAYVYGATYVARNSQARPSFLDEHWSNVGFRSFFARAFLYKTPLALMALLVLAAGALAISARSRRRSAANASEPIPWLNFSPLAVIVVVYGLLAIFTRLNIGHRHLLPLYPALFIFCGFAGWFALVERSRSFAACLLLLVSWEIGSTLSVSPHYLAYFNAAAGGPDNAYKHLVDSSLDWGQDLPDLKTWLDEFAGEDTKTSPVYLAYFGTADPLYYGITAEILPEEPHASVLKPLRPGLYCVSATILQHVYEVDRGPWSVDYERAYRASQSWAGSLPEELVFKPLDREADPLFGKLRICRSLRFGRLCAYLRHQKPVANVGYSILVFRLTARDIDAALNGPPAELTPTIEVALE